MSLDGVFVCATDVCKELGDISRMQTVVGKELLTPARRGELSRNDKPASCKILLPVPARMNS